MAAVFSGPLGIVIGDEIVVRFENRLRDGWGEKGGGRRSSEIVARVTENDDTKNADRPTALLYASVPFRFNGA